MMDAFHIQDPVRIAAQKTVAQRLREAVLPEFDTPIYVPVRGGALWKSCFIKNCNAIGIHLGGLCGHHCRELCLEIQKKQGDVQANEVETFVYNLNQKDQPVVSKPPTYSFIGLPPLLADEIRITLQRMTYPEDGQRYTLTYHWSFARIMKVFKWLDIKSIFDIEEGRALEIVMKRPVIISFPQIEEKLKNIYPSQVKEAITLIRSIMRLTAEYHAPVPVEDRLIWYPTDFGLPTPPAGKHGMAFYSFMLDWMVKWAKRWALYEIRMGRQTFSSLMLNITGMRHFDNFLAQQLDCPKGIAGITRNHIERFLLWLRAENGPGIGKNNIVGVVARVRSLFSLHSELQWTPKMQPDAILRRGECPRSDPPVPQPIDPFVLGQLMSRENLAKFAPWLMDAIIIGRYQGLRPSSVGELPLKCLEFNSEGDERPVLIYRNVKLSRIARQPIMRQDVLDTIRRQQARVRLKYGNECLYLFPSSKSTESNKGHPLRPSSLQAALNYVLNRDCDIRNRSGVRVLKLTWGQFRDTRATELLNAGVAPSIVAKWLDHNNLSSLEHYCNVHSETIRAAIESAPLINLEGKNILENMKDQQGSTRDVEDLRRLIKQATNVVQGGYCTLPVQEECPHLNRCYSCQKFATTPEKLPNLLSHLQESEMLMVVHQEHGRNRMAEAQTRNIAGLNTVVVALTKYVLTAPPLGPELTDWVDVNRDTLIALVEGQP